MKPLLEGKALEDFNNWYMDENYMLNGEPQGLSFRMSINGFNHFLNEAQQVDTILKFFYLKFNHYVEIGMDQTSYPKFGFKIIIYEGFSEFDELPQDQVLLYRTEEEAKMEALKLIMASYNESKTI